MRVKSLSWICATGISCCLLGACNNQVRRSQELWNQRMHHTIHAVDNLLSHGSLMVPEKQLIALAGLEPDWRIKATRFAELYIENDPSQKRAMRDVWTAYCIRTRSPCESDCDDEDYGWKHCEAFKRTTLWVYDESKHFTKPLGSNDLLECIFCAKPCFLVAFFFVRDGNVIGSAYAVHDLPFRRLDG